MRAARPHGTGEPPVRTINPYMNFNRTCFYAKLRLFLSFSPLLILFFCTQAQAQKNNSKPNVIFILADDLGYGDVGVYGQQKIKTPNIDRLAADGMKFTTFYAGSTVCAPSRSVLMTGKHTGHTTVRGNAGPQNAAIQSLKANDKTVAEIFKNAGYATALIGKWGLGEIGMAGHPNKKGFDYFYGYLNQSHAHNYWPSFLVRNSEIVKLKNVLGEENRVGAGWAKEKVEYSGDLIAAEALQWLDKNHQQPFFLYYSPTLPHANNEANRALGNGSEIPDYGIYKNENWPAPEKGKAAMITYLDNSVGQILARLKQYGIEKNTLVIFTSDNGPHKEAGNDPDFFKSSGAFSGIKRAMTDGGIRVPFIARWPEKIKAGASSTHVGYFGDFFALACDLTKQKTPSALDSISFLSALTNKKQAQHEYLYWEFYEGEGKQAVRFGNWKAIREPMFTGAITLYDLSRDIGETKNVAAENPKIVAQAEQYLRAAHTPDANWKPTKQ